MYSLNSKLQFGHHKGRTVGNIFTGSPLFIQMHSMALAKESLNILFNKENYISSSGIISFNFENIDSELYKEFLHSFFEHNISYSFDISIHNKVNVIAYDKDKNISNKYSKLGFDIALNYLTQDLCPDEIYPGIHTRAYNVISTSEDIFPRYNAILKKLSSYEANPLYIFWCIKHIKSFYLEGDKKCIKSLQYLPCFYLHSFTTLFKSETHAVLNPLIESRQVEIYQNTININHKKFNQYTYIDYEINNERNDIYKEAFDELTDGQYGDYSGDSDDIQDRIGF